MEQQIAYEQPLNHDVLTESDVLEFIDDEIPKSWDSNQEPSVNDDRDLYWEDGFADYAYRERDFYDEYHYDRWVD